MSKIRDGWRTPPELARNLVALGSLDLDAASSPDNAICARRLDDGLRDPWVGKVWCNPPYSETGKWIDRAIEQTGSGVCLMAYLLVPAQIGTSWFTRALQAPSVSWWAFDKRIQFVPPEGVRASSNTLGSVLLVFHPGAPGRGYCGLRSSKTGLALPVDSHAS